MVRKLKILYRVRKRRRVADRDYPDNYRNNLPAAECTFSVWTIAVRHDHRCCRTVGVLCRPRTCKAGTACRCPFSCRCTSSFKNRTRARTEGIRDDHAEMWSAVIRRTVRDVLTLYDQIPLGAVIESISRLLRLRFFDRRNDFHAIFRLPMEGIIR